MVEYFWSLPTHEENIALAISAKFKILRRGLKEWSKHLSNLNQLIHNSGYVLGLLDGLEEQRPLSLLERNFRHPLKLQLLNLLDVKKMYWKQRSMVRSVKFVDENTKLFHAIATQKYRRNYVSHLYLSGGSSTIDHE
jgi:hypothetical protein